MMPSFKMAMITARNSSDSQWRLLESLYNDNFLNGAPSPSPRIPKIIHQIWLGSPLPPRCVELQRTWIEKHPEWEYHLWTDAEAQKLTLQNRDIYQATKNLGAKSDMLRYELLYRFGGMYVDTDFECLKPFDEFHYLCDFYSGVYDPSFCYLQNALIACAPGDVIIKECIDNIKQIPSSKNADQIMNETGPQYFTQCAFKWLAGADRKRIIFPINAFYPLPNMCRFESLEKQKDFIKPESYAIHYWHVSWRPQKWWRKKLGKIKRRILKALSGSSS